MSISKVTRAGTLLILLGSSWLIAGCSSASDTSDSSPQPPDPAAAIVKPFFQHYRAHMQKHSYDFVSGGYPLRHSFYHLNKPQVAAYLGAVAQCGPVSSAYLARLQAHFQQVKQQLARTPQDDGEIEGLEYDLVSHDGDDDDFYLSLDTAQLSLRQVRPGARLYALRTGVELVVKVIPTPKGWQIDSVDIDRQAVD